MREVLLIAGFAIAYSLTSTGDYWDERRDAVHYCAMVDTWIRFQGTRGHPNYEDRDCSWYEATKP
ncbi:MAG: hypothetical protein Unbinned1502contig1001_6 [Prokaryotic dsDNA virus sp.]|nr:MAG: hypothetical protein Unbinned1502contig1001_6 [Prokaryotic dsDNA virus sp.]